MEEYISKSAVNAEIKRLLKSAEAYLKYHHDINNKKEIRPYYSEVKYKYEDFKKYMEE